jgi:hypothetical protein
MRIVNPVAARASGTRPPTGRPVRLAGLRAGLLHNGKPGGEVILERIAARLRDEHGVAEVLRWRKPHPSAGATFLAELRASCDVVVGALSD